jgi:hypothetical protein
MKGGGVTHNIESGPDKIISAQASSFIYLRRQIKHKTILYSISFSLAHLALGGHMSFCHHLAFERPTL